MARVGTGGKSPCVGDLDLLPVPNGEGMFDLSYQSVQM